MIGIARAALVSPTLARGVIIDQVGAPSLMDPQQQWKQDGYYVYRVGFDNLARRNNAVENVPQIVTSGNHVSDTEMQVSHRQITDHPAKTVQGSDVTLETIASANEMERKIG